jgi:hypothetical protein
MTLEQLSQVAEIVGFIIVVVTLIYLSVQLKQGADLLRSESRQAQVNNGLIGVYKLVEHPELGSAFSGKDEPSFADKVRLQFWIIGQMRSREHEWLQYKSGALDEETWASYRGVIYFVLGTERARALWNLCHPYFNAEFTEMVDKMLEDAPYVDFWEKLEAVE